MKPHRGAPQRRGALPHWGGFQTVRIAILLLVLLAAALTTWADRYRSTRWQVPLYVAIYPIAADGSAVTRAYLASLDPERFKPIDRFFARAAGRYHLATDEPVKTRLRRELPDRPPQRAPDAGLLATALWSLRLRIWAWRAGGQIGRASCRERV